jgi:tetratricopeptide (TPR) repeat protein
VDKKNQLLDLLRKSDQSELNFISDISDEERAAIGAAQEWAVKDEIIHIAAWKAIMSERFVHARADKSPPGNDDWDAVNEEIFRRHREDTWQEVLEFRERSYQQLVEQIQSFDEDDLVDEQRYDWLNGRSLWKQTIHSGYLHPHWHIALLYSKRGELERAGRLMEEITKTLVTLDESPRWQGQSIYSLACFYALSGDSARAIDNLGRAFSLSSDMVEWSREDTDLASIWEEPGYRALVD